MNKPDRVPSGSALTGDWLPQHAALNRAAAQPGLQHLQAQVALLIRLLDDEFLQTDHLIIAENHTLTTGLLDVHARTPLRLISYVHTLDGWERVSVNRLSPSPSPLDSGPLHLQEVLRAGLVGDTYRLSDLRASPGSRSDQPQSPFQTLFAAVLHRLPWVKPTQTTGPVPVADNPPLVTDLSSLNDRDLTSIEQLPLRSSRLPEGHHAQDAQDNILTRMSDL